MIWDYWLCPTDWCRSGGWLAQRINDVDLWRVVRVAGGQAWTIAAATPVCPHCGATLAAGLELPALGGLHQTTGRILHR